MSKIKVTDILASTLLFDFDYDKIKKEILDIRPHWIYTPPYQSNLDAGMDGKFFLSETPEMYRSIDSLDDFGITSKKFKGQHALYLRKHIDNPTNNTKFSYTKKLPTDGWDWAQEIKTSIPYTIECIESLPYTKIGCIRVFITENTFFPTHRDSNAGEELVLSTDYDKALGISIIPDTGNVPMYIQSFDSKTVHSVTGNAILFNDSALHGVPFTEGCRITIRVFGEMDFQKLEPFLDPNSIIK